MLKKPKVRKFEVFGLPVPISALTVEDTGRKEEKWETGRRVRRTALAGMLALARQMTIPAPNCLRKLKWIEVFARIIVFVAMAFKPYFPLSWLSPGYPTMCLSILPS